ncbi:DUF302 domain-containing protein [Halobium salinum]|uniref:DUF302 domain-containing protein n=1 Tax=Halobium salinum TaxID=1364940 RepID=A0ABD5P7T5_9EURY|nr:DUF302 domain-containing protein [Halobium salinum]
MEHPVTYTISERSPFGFEETLGLVRDALDAQGFELLFETDLQAAVRGTVGDDGLGRYTVIGACMPETVAEALAVDPDLGALLACAVAVREDEAGVVVTAVDPAATLSVVDSPELEIIGDDARNRLTRVVSGATVAVDPAEA